MEHLDGEIGRSRDIEWNLLWLHAIIRFNEHVLKGCRSAAEYSGQAHSIANAFSHQQASQAENMRGRGVLLKLYSSLNFHNDSFKKIVDQNQNMISFMVRASKKQKAEQEMDEQASQLDE
mmetsp:Transcript_3379/g.5682  ORF Transcript_3379/g.5682 Transcript_3379/m.5682 type:complete len:120 (-) Transcript_3379:71-430(-)